MEQLLHIENIYHLYFLDLLLLFFFQSGESIYDPMLQILSCDNFNTKVELILKKITVFH